MLITRVLTNLRTTGLDIYGRSLRYTRLASTDQGEKDDSDDEDSFSPTGSSRESPGNAALSFSSTLESLSSKLEDGRPQFSEPFLRPLQPEGRGLARRVRIWLIPLVGCVLLVTIISHGIVTSGKAAGQDGTSVIVANSTEAGSTSTSANETLIDDTQKKPSKSNSSIPLGIFQDGSWQLNNGTHLDEEHRTVTDLLGLTSSVDLTGAEQFSLSTQASDLYMVIEPKQQPEQPKTYPALRPVAGLSGTQLESWFLYGIIDNGWTKPRLPKTPRVDVVMTWVNGSDPLWALERSKKVAKHGLKFRMPGMARHWRDNGMGPYPLRSIVDAFAEPKAESDLRRIHLVTADMQLDGIGFNRNLAAGEESRLPSIAQKGKKWTIGQVPSWLDQTKLVPLLDDRPSTDSRNVELQWHFHSQAFQIPDSFFQQSTTVSDKSETSIQWNDADEWKRDALPTYNSFAIEWQMGWLEGVGDISVHMNDDMLLLAPLNSADFYSIPFGSVLRVDSTFQLRVSPQLDPSKVTDTGEWGGLQHANYLLSQRFPERRRHYLHHLPKTLSKPIIHEAMHMFGEAIAVASSRPFREVNIGNGDIEMGFLVTHLRIERWREALLWTWAVGKMGNLTPDETSIWGDAARAELRSVLELDDLDGSATVVKQERDTLKDVESVFRKGAWDQPKSTSYSFSSMDGTLPEIQLYAREGPETCIIDLKRCLGEAFVNGTQDLPASELFKHLAFEDWKCGDCLINALVNKSGKSGLSAFFPDKDLVVRNATVNFEVAHLPLTPNWRATDFSLESITQGDDAPFDLDLQMWSMKMLSRYLYVTGDTPSRFATLNQATQTNRVIAQLDADSSVAMVCFNDDARKNQEERISNVIHEWLDKKFEGKDMYWEKPQQE